MNRTDRMLAIVLELQAHGQRRANDLAATFEVSKRTIYRDVQALCEAGVPVVAEAGRGYSLPEGYFLPPLRFSPAEATMLLLGADVMAQSFDAEYRLAAEAAARKIAGALGDERRAAVQSLRTTIGFFERGRSTPHTDELLCRLRGAIVSRQRLRISYRARHSAAAEERAIDPYGLARVEGVWYVVGYCHLRQSTRTFRLERITRAEALPQHFERPADFALHTPSDTPPILVRALFSAAVADWVRETPPYHTVAAEQRPDGSLLLTLRTRRLADLLPWLLGWGRHLSVLEPPALRDLVAAEAAAMLATHLPESD